MAKKRKGLSKKIRFQVLQRDNFTCQYCGRGANEIALDVDHILPVAKGGENDMSNLITSCWECNIGKGVTSAELGKVLEVSPVCRPIIGAFTDEEREQVADMLLSVGDEKVTPRTLAKAIYQLGHLAGYLDRRADTLFNQEEA